MSLRNNFSKDIVIESISAIRLSIVMVSFNTSSMTVDTLDKLFDNLYKTNMIGHTEVIIIDNASRDDSVKAIKEFAASHQALKIKLKANHKNIGFAAGNNQGFDEAEGEYILMLNTDVLVTETTDLGELIEFMQTHPQVGALTLKLLLTDGNIDPASHRGLATPWRALTYFLKMEKIFGKIPILGKIFGGYHLTYLDIQKTHQVEAITGAFFLTRKSIIDKLEGFDERFFMYGEDLDLCFRIRELGYQIIYHPVQVAYHLKHRSGLKNPDPNAVKLTKYAFWDAMWLFYEKNMIDHYPSFIGDIIKWVIYRNANKYQTSN